MTVKLVDIRCTSCGKLLGKVQEGAAHEHKCPRCKEFTGFKLINDAKQSIFVNGREIKPGETVTYKNRKLWTHI